MRTIPAPEVDAWLRAGGVVVAASDRAGRAVRAAYHRARRAEGLNAWAAPEVLDWNAFARKEWEARVMDGRLILNATQEQSLWSRIVAESEHTAGWLEGPRRRLADLAAGAQDLLCAHAPDLLRAAPRRTWQQDAAAFSDWLSSFDELCTRSGLVSSSRLPMELLAALEKNNGKRPVLVLAGFDRLLPVQRRVLDAWGEWRPIDPSSPTVDVHSYAAPNEQLELAACARWCRQQLDANPQAKLLVVVQDANQRRGEMERAFLHQSPQFEFSLGIPLVRVGLARAALVLLRWLDGAIEEHDLDWLLASGSSVTTPEETAALQAYMRVLRRRGMQRTQWTLDAFVRQPAGPAAPTVAWVERITNAQQRLRKASARMQSPLDWAALASQLLQAIGWPGSRQLTSAEFQAANRWQQALDVCGSLGFDGRRIAWTEFVCDLDRTLVEMLFAEESQDSAILIAGPAESAGLTADGIWFLGADENAWPAGGSTHPLLPIDVQREARMPHATPQLDWELAESVTMRLLSSARQVCFSYARLKEDVETRPSRLVVQHAGAPQSLPALLIPEAPRAPVAVKFEDTAAIALPSVAAKKSTRQLSLFDDTGTEREVIEVHQVPGGSTILTSQSQCAFKAFATARLGAQGWENAEPGLTASQRGQLLHAVLHAVWSDTPQGIRTSNALQNLGADLRAFVEGRVRSVLKDEMPVGAREQMPARYLELEEQRLTRLVTEWLEYERARLPFEVEATEVDSAASPAGLTLKLRLDRVDRLNDGSLLVIDYKSGNVSPRSWELPRPDDVQLPLYAGFALPSDQELGGLVFAKVRLGDMGFAGKVADALATIDNTLNGNSSMVKGALTPMQLSEWRRAVEQLARDFIAGRADVDPREYPKTCDRCGLFTLCRVREREDQQEPEEEETGTEAGDE
jgi:ATP-dependent helicase/nuclease subunit B